MQGPSGVVLAGTFTNSVINKFPIKASKSRQLLFPIAEKLSMNFFILALLLLVGPVLAQPCGKEGSLEERIKQCNFAKGEFVLVHRNEKGHEVYKDQKSGLIWADRISTDFNQYGSQKACADADEFLKDFKWRLPTINEFKTAATHGMKAALPNMKYWFWTSSAVKMKKRGRRWKNPAQYYLWDGTGEVFETGDLRDAASVRCVAKP